jgi:hypothetical protein
MVGLAVLVVVVTTFYMYGIRLWLFWTLVCESSNVFTILA